MVCPSVIHWFKRWCVRLLFTGSNDGVSVCYSLVQTMVCPSVIHWFKRWCVRLLFTSVNDGVSVCYSLVQTMVCPSVIHWFKRWCVRLLFTSVNDVYLCADAGGRLILSMAVMEIRENADKDRMKKFTQNVLPLFTKLRYHSLTHSLARSLTHSLTHSLSLLRLENKTKRLVWMV